MTQLGAQWAVWLLSGEAGRGPGEGGAGAGYLLVLLKLAASAQGTLMKLAGVTRLATLSP